MNYNELVRIEDIVKAYQDFLGNEFKVCLEKSLNVEENRVPIILYVTRMPYKINNIDSETLQIGISSYVECENETNYLEQIKRISKIIGFNVISFTSQKRTYKMYSYIDFSRPLTDPVVDSGKFMQQLNLSGTCLVQGVNGALIGNEVTTKLVFNPLANDGSLIEGQIQVLDSTTQLVKVAESAQMANELVAKGINRSQLHSYSYTILILKNKICERIFKGIKGIEPFALNERVDLKESYPAMTDDSFSLIKNCVLTDAQLAINAGSFVTATITLQERLNLG